MFSNCVSTESFLIVMIYEVVKASAVPDEKAL